MIDRDELKELLRDNLDLVLDVSDIPWLIMNFNGEEIDRVALPIRINCSDDFDE